jgi:hypothetical protein
MGAQRSFGTTKFLLNCKKKESARLDKISDLQGVLKDFTVISVVGFNFFFYFSLTLQMCEIEKTTTNMSKLWLRMLNGDCF